jgi:ERCC4-related helicase
LKEVTNFEHLKDRLGIEWRPYQIEAVQEILETHPQSVLLNYPYGTGKTVIALLVMYSIKQQNPNAKIIFTSAREAAALRCRQALEMAKQFGFLEYLGYLFDPKLGGKGLSLKQKSRMYEAADVILSPITVLSNDSTRIRNKTGYDFFADIDYCVIDEATDIIARDISGYRISKYFDLILRKEKKPNFSFLCLTGSRDLTAVQAIHAILNKTVSSSKLMRRMDLFPYETSTSIEKIHREDFIEIDRTISNAMNTPVTKIQEIFGKKISKLNIVKLSYSGILDRLQDKTKNAPMKIGSYIVPDEKARQHLISAFVQLFKLTHSRLLLLESTPGKFLEYVGSEEMQNLFPHISNAANMLIQHRDQLRLFDHTDEFITRALLSPKISAAADLCYEPVMNGAKILMFTRYIALGKQVLAAFKAMHFPSVRFLSGKTSEEHRQLILKEFSNGLIDILIFTPVGSRGLNLSNADVVIHLDITTNIDDMIQRRERARGCMEYILVLAETSEEPKLREYINISGETDE